MKGIGSLSKPAVVLFLILCVLGVGIGFFGGCFVYDKTHGNMTSCNGVLVVIVVLVTAPHFVADARAKGKTFPLRWPRRRSRPARAEDQATPAPQRKK